MEEAINPWKTISNETRYENPWLRLEHHEVITPAGKPGIYGKVHLKNIAVVVLPIDSNGFTYLVGQYRYTLGSYSWELPEGGCLIDSEENTLDAAKRELKEETGLVATHWESVCHIHLSNSVTDECAELFIAQELIQEVAKPEETERLIIKKIPLEEAINMAMQGEITDALSVIILLKYAALQIPGLHGR